MKRLRRWLWPLGPRPAMTFRDALGTFINTVTLVGGALAVAVMLSYHVQSQEQPCRIGINCEAGQYLDYQEHP